MSLHRKQGRVQSKCFMCGGEFPVHPDVVIIFIFLNMLIISPQSQRALTVNMVYIQNKIMSSPHTNLVTTKLVQA